MGLSRGHPCRSPPAVPAEALPNSALWSALRRTVGHPAEPIAAPIRRVHPIHQPAPVCAGATAVHFAVVDHRRRLPPLNCCIGRRLAARRSHGRRWAGRAAAPPKRAASAGSFSGSRAPTSTTSSNSSRQLRGLRLDSSAEMAAAGGIQAAAGWQVGAAAASLLVLNGLVLAARRAISQRDRFRAFVPRLWSNRPLFGTFACSAGPEWPYLAH